MIVYSRIGAGRREALSMGGAFNTIPLWQLADQFKANFSRLMIYRTAERSPTDA